MAKKIIHRYEFFDASARTVTINEVIAQKRLLTITNTTAKTKFCMHSLIQSGAHHHML